MSSTTWMKEYRKRCKKAIHEFKTVVKENKYLNDAMTTMIKSSGDMTPEDAGQNFDADNLSWFVRLNNKYTLPGNVDWQTRLFYRGPSETAQSRNQGIFSMDLAFSKDLFKDKASLAVNVRDVFNSRKRRSDNFTDSFNNYGEFQRRVRSFNLAFTYRFNQQKQRDRNGRSNGRGGEDFDFEG